MPTAVMYRVMEQVQTQIRALALTDMTSANVVIKWKPRQLRVAVDPLPAIQICPAPMPEPMPQDLANSDKVHYPVLISIQAVQNKDYDANIERNLLWREKINREFRYQNLDNAISEIIHCLPMPKSIFDVQAWEENLWRSDFVMLFVSRELRGN